MSATHVITLSETAIVTVEPGGMDHGVWVNLRDGREQYNILMPESALDQLCVALANKRPLAAVRDEGGV